MISSMYATRLDCVNRIGTAPCILRLGQPYSLPTGPPHDAALFVWPPAAHYDLTVAEAPLYSSHCVSVSSCRIVIGPLLYKRLSHFGVRFSTVIKNIENPTLRVGSAGVFFRGR